MKVAEGGPRGERASDDFGDDAGESPSMTAGVDREKGSEGIRSMMNPLYRILRLKKFREIKHKCFRYINYKNYKMMMRIWDKIMKQQD